MEERTVAVGDAGGGQEEPNAPRAPSTVYGGRDQRPWIVIGETDTGDLIAAPPNDASNPRWWTPVIPRAALSFPGNVRESQLELAHAWSRPAGIVSLGEVTSLGRGAVQRAVRAAAAFVVVHATHAFRAHAAW